MFDRGPGVLVQSQADRTTRVIKNHPQATELSVAEMAGTGDAAFKLRAEAIACQTGLPRQHGKKQRDENTGFFDGQPLTRLG